MIAIIFHTSTILLNKELLTKSKPPSATYPSAPFSKSTSQYLSPPEKIGPATITPRAPPLLRALPPQSRSAYDRVSFFKATSLPTEEAALRLSLPSPKKILKAATNPFTEHL